MEIPTGHNKAAGEKSDSAKDATDITNRPKYSLIIAGIILFIGILLFVGIVFKIKGIV